MGLIDWPSEKVCGALLHLRQIGALPFANKDNAILASFAKKLKTTGFLTERQIDFARYKLRRHMHILRDTDFAPFQIKTDEHQGKAPELFFSLHNRKKFRVYVSKATKSLTPIIQQLHGLSRPENADYYLCEATKRNWYVLFNSGFVANERVIQWMERPAPAWQKLPVNNLLNGIMGKARDFQVDGISYLMHREGRALLADEMGLGKSMQAIAWAKLAQVHKIGVVCEASLKINWKREIVLWTGEKSICVLSGKILTQEMISDLRMCKWVIINYDILQYWQEELTRTGISAYIFDECQAIKNPDALRTKAAQAVTKKARHVIGLSGTPFENRPIEFYTIIKMVDPVLFPIKAKYEKRYCLRTLKDGSYDYKGASNTKELNRILSDTILLRRLKKDVLKDLPEKTRAVVPIEASNSKAWEAYFNAENNFAAWMKEKYPDMTKKQEQRKAKAEALLKINALKQLVAEAKLPLVFDWIDTYLSVENKLVVFAAHRAIMDALQARYSKNSVRLDGGTEQRARQVAVDKFQDNPNINLFLGNLRAAGKGLTLTAARDTLTIELGWTSTLHDQAEDRTHRMGQKNAVTAYYIIAADTIEERIAKLIDSKRGVVAQVLDGEDPVDSDLLDNLLNMYTA